MKNLEKLIYPVLLILIGTSYANAKLIQINQNDPNAKYLMYVDFDKKKSQSPDFPVYSITMETDSVDKETKKDYPYVNFEDYSKNWLTEDYIIDCLGKDSYITNENSQLMGTYKGTNITVTIPTGAYASTSRRLNPKNETDKLIYEQTCEPKQ